MTPIDVGSEIRPRTGKVVLQPDQIDLLRVFMGKPDPEADPKPEEKRRREQRGASQSSPRQPRDPRLRAPRNSLVRHAGAHTKIRTMSAASFSRISRADRALTTL